MKYVIFDFNGTVLDDTDVCIKIENESIKKYLPDRKPLTKDEYLRSFCFPVKKYYEKIGYKFDTYTYEQVSVDWYNMYEANKSEYKLHDGVVDLLNKNIEKGYKNILLSVSPLNKLRTQIKELNIEHLFDEVLGINDIYANSKLQIGLNWIKDKIPKECIMIGDTTHDYEVATAMGVECVLVANGHQAKEVLLKETNKVIDNIMEVEL